MSLGRLSFVISRLIFISIFLSPLGSLYSFNLPSRRNCELMSVSSPSHQQHGGLGGQTTTTTTTTNQTTPSLGLLHLLRQHGISASPHPHCNLHYSHGTKPTGSAATGKGGGSPPGRQGRLNVFSLNLVEKLHSLGLHRVAAWGMTGRNEEKRRET